MDTTDPTPIRSVKQESLDAARAYTDYRDMDAPRSLDRLVRCYQSASEPPPTRRLKTLADWSRTYDWQGRLLAEQARQDALRQQAADRALQDATEKRTRRIENVGTAALGVAEAILRTFVIESGPDRGQLNPATAGRVSPRDLAPVMKAGIDAVQLAAGAPTSITTAAIDKETWARMLAEADEPTRMKMVEGLRAIVEMQRRVERAGAL